jgi:fructokinase
VRRIAAEPKTIVAIGEALWDVFPDRRRPGGAPCNVAFHAARLGDRGVIITRVGDDTAGAELTAFLGERGVVTDYVQEDDARPTGTVSVTIEDADPRYAITEDVAWDYIAAEDGARALARTANAVCIGSLAQRREPSHAAIHQLLSDARGHALVIFDVNLRPPFVDPGVLDVTFRAADVVRMNESEVARISTLLDRPSLTAWLLEEMGVQVVCVTRGRDGASITTPRGTASAPAVEIDTSAGDAVGAGDAFTAALAHQLARDATPHETLHAANRYAALVAAKKGAMPVISDEDLAGIGL